MQDDEKIIVYSNKRIKFENILCGIEEIITISVFVVMLALMVFQVIFRYVLKLPLPWSEELIRYLFVITSFFGAAIASSERSHIEINLMETIINLTKDAKKRQVFTNISWLIADCISFVILVIFSYYSYGYLQRMLLTQQKSSAMEMPVWWIISAMFVGAVLMAIHYICKIGLTLTGLTLKKEGV